MVAQIRGKHRFRAVIEIGAGGGRWTRWLHTRSDRMLCIDRATASAKHIAALGLEPPPMNLVCTYGHLPTGPGSPLHDAFDFGFSYDTFVHLDRVTIATYMRSLRDAIRPGGHAVIHVATDENKLPEQPTDRSGCWQPINEACFNELARSNGFRLLDTIRARHGYGSRVCSFRRE